MFVVRLQSHVMHALILFFGLRLTHSHFRPRLEATIDHEGHFPDRRPR